MGTPTILLVEDEPSYREILASYLRQDGYEVYGVGDAETALEAIGSFSPSLVLIDVALPQMDGMQLCRLLKSREETSHVPVIVYSGNGEQEIRADSLAAGADDFLDRPLNKMDLSEVRARVRSFVRLHGYYAEAREQQQLLAGQQKILEEQVRERTRQLEDLQIGLVAALERINSLNDLDTGNHIRRVCRYSEIVGMRLGLDSAFVQKVRLFASLHDVGKVGISPEILKKEGGLTSQEYEEMKRHTWFGYQILKAARADEVACQVALCHHERYDGTGYPRGLKGEEIPVEARIVSLADVFDALTTKRCYKEAFPADESRKMILAASGTHFDPAAVDALAASWSGILDVQREYRDSPQDLSSVEEVERLEREWRSAQAKPQPARRRKARNGK